MSKSEVHHINVRNRKVTLAYLKFRTIGFFNVFARVCICAIFIFSLFSKLTWYGVLGSGVFLCMSCIEIAKAMKRNRIVRKNNFVLLPARIANCSENEYMGDIETGNSFSVDVTFRYTYQGRHRTVKVYLDDLTERDLTKAKQFHLAFALNNQKLASMPFLVIRGKDYQIEEGVGAYH